MMKKGDWLLRWNSYSPESIALIDGDSGKQLTYSQLYSLSCRAAGYFASEHGIGRGFRVAALATNSLEYVVLFFALQRLGATLIPLNHRLTRREIAQILEDCEPHLLLYEATFVDQIPSGFTQSIPFFGKNSWSMEMEMRNNFFTEFLSEDDSTSLILYTSGTTGAPKGAMLSQDMIFWNSVNTSLRLNITQKDKAVIFLPMFHTSGWNVLTLPFLHRGACIILTKKFSAPQILDLSETHCCTLLFGVPTTMELISESANFLTKDLSSLRYAIVGGEPMALKSIETWNSRGVAIRQGYGLTEFGPNVFSLNEADSKRKIGSVGFANFYIETKVVTSSGSLALPNEVGELWLRGSCCMQGYWKNPTATQAAITEDGWLKTGDLVSFDEEGFFFIRGRKKDMYISGGENVYPAEIEQVLRKFPGIKEAAVIGVPDRKWGEVGRAFLVTDGPLQMDSLKKYCELSFAKFKIPKYFDFLAELPKGDSGKILKKVLADKPLFTQNDRT
jgi:fatty-acyl-CoA synthase